jgi:hypothetical protein
MGLSTHSLQFDALASSYLCKTHASLVLRFVKNSSRYCKIKPAAIAKLRVATEMSKKATPYQLGHGLMYAIEVVSMTSNGEVTCRCKFCVYEGRDEVEVSVVGCKCKQCSDIRYFTKPFLPGKYCSHRVGQHGASWMLYQLLFVTEKKAYFHGKIKRTNMLHAHMDLATDMLEFVIRRSIVETIISDLFFRDDEQLDECNGNDSDDNMDAAVAIAYKVAKQANQKTNVMTLFDQRDNGYICDHQ